MSHRVLRVSTVASATALAATMGQVIIGSMTEQQLGPIFIAVPILTTMLLGAVSNALDVQFIPKRIRDAWHTGLRNRLWKSGAGEWLARRLGAPERSRVVVAGAFRATEAALGVAASELFAALPNAYREQLAELPATIAALEARAGAAREDVELLAALAPSGSSDAAVLATRREEAAAHLAQSVAALERIRLDLLRLHAGASDLAPLTTVIDEARLLSEHAGRLVDAQQEVNAATGTRPHGTRKVATPA